MHHFRGRAAFPHAFAGNERFALVRELGAGSMGVVYEAIDRLSGARVALKALPFSDASAVSQFKHEFRSLAALVHPNLVSLYELVVEDDRWFFTMELVEGPDFLTWARGARGAPRDPPRAGLAFNTVVDEQRLRSAIVQLAEGVAALHDNGVLHRDLKPSNVLVRNDGRLAILDFGIAIEIGDAQRGSSADPRRAGRIGSLR
jgi:serine/threonine protein kinase